MEEVAELGVWEAAGRMADALERGALEGLQALCDPGFWERAGATELGGVAAGAVTVTLLGTLPRRSLLDAQRRGGARTVIEQQWTAAPGGPLVEDERLFTLADRAEIEASGDPERIERMATKLAAQDAARRYAAALAARDVDAARAMWAPAFADAHGDELRPLVAAVADAELIAAVGPRTLVRVWYTGSDETVELLWRPEGGGWAIAGARTFRRPGAG